MKTIYRDLAPALQDTELLSNQASMIVGHNGKHSIRREWERVQMKSHQINTSILKVGIEAREDLDTSGISL